MGPARGGEALMETVNKAGFPLVGVIFLGVALVNFLRGDNWVVWLILGALFGGLAIFRRRGKGQG